MEYINIKGARQHNLKDISIKIPRRSLTVVTGVSGSGKSSLAFDTLFAEGQRRFMESLSAYARQFIEKLEKPDVDYIEGLSPSISVDQKTFHRNPRSTVGTITEIYDFMRLLYARIGIPNCPNCDIEIVTQTVDSMVEKILHISAGKDVYIYSPIIQGRKGEYRKELEDLKEEGFLRVRIDGTEYDLDDEIKLSRYKNHTIELLIDVIGSKSVDRMEESLRLALKRSGGVARCETNNETLNFSESYSCPGCGFIYAEISPRLFSFNSPYGACEKCNGLGVNTFFDPELIIEDPGKSLAKGAITPWKNSTYYKNVLNSLGEHYGFSMDTPFNKLKKNIREKILFGTGDEEILFTRKKKKWSEEYYETYSGVVDIISNWYKETDSDEIRESLSKYLVSSICDECVGSRLKKESLSVKLNKNSIYDLSSRHSEDLLKFFENIKLSEREKIISERVIFEIISRLKFLVDVGLSYLSLDRSAPTLSGGEAQRIRLATQVGSQLTGITYVLDEPSIGLHPRDNEKLLDTLKSIRDSGNTVVVVEHDEDTIRNSDFILDIGPGAGEHGGKIVAAGDVDHIIGQQCSLTGKYLSGKLTVDQPKKRRKPKGFIKILKAAENNLKEIDADFPIGVFSCVTGVSGSGKSTLVIDILYNFLSKKLYKSKTPVGKIKDVKGFESINKIIDVDQNPIGRTPRSNPATYTGLFTDIRDIFSMLPEAKAKGYGPGRFSFNVKDGRCSHCSGDGNEKIEMHFLSDVYVTCEKCGGKRYNDETLEIKFKGYSIADVLDMTVEDALAVFENFPKLKNKLAVLNEVGLDYIRLGQASTTISGGEAQRIKLSKELSKKSTGNTLYILDEPSVGLHFEDVKKLLTVIQKLVDLGNTVVVIEHNIDIIKCADYIIDLGPEGGSNGGNIVAAGTPESVAKSKGSYTGKFLKKALRKK